MRLAAAAAAFVAALLPQVALAQDCLDTDATVREPPPTFCCGPSSASAGPRGPGSASRGPREEDRGGHEEHADLERREHDRVEGHGVRLLEDEPELRVHQVQHDLPAPGWTRSARLKKASNPIRTTCT